MICSRCNVENPEGTAFCRECGNPLSSVVNLRKDEVGHVTSNPYNGSSNSVDFSANNNIPFEQNPFEQNPFEQNSYQQQPQYNQAQNNQNQYGGQQFNQSQPYQQQVPNYPVLPNPDADQMTTLDWILRYCINFIPLVGPIIYLVMLFVWAFGDTPKKSLKTFAQAQLIMAGVGIALMIVFMIIAAMAGYDLSDELYY